MNRITLLIANIAQVIDGSMPRRQTASFAELTTTAGGVRPMNFPEALEVLTLLVSNMTLRKPALTHTETYQIRYQEETTAVTLSDNSTLLLTPRRKKSGFSIRIVFQEIGKGGYAKVYKTIGFKLYLQPYHPPQLISQPETHHKAFKCCVAPDRHYQRLLATMRKEQHIFQLMHGRTRPLIIHQNQLWLMMEQFPYPNLHTMCYYSQWLLPVSDKIIIAYKCIIEVMRLHELGWIHADLKLAQFLCRQTGPHYFIFLIDFGSAVAIDEASRFPAPKCYTTPDYAAPEIFLNYKKRNTDILTYNTKIDVYGLGVALAELFANRVYKEWLLRHKHITSEFHQAPSLDYTYEATYGAHLQDFIKTHTPPQVQNLLLAMTKANPKHRCSLPKAIHGTISHASR